MIVTEQQKQAQEVIQNIIMKCWEDESFKENLKNDPVITIEKFVGHSITVPEGHELIVVDQSHKNNIYMNIPAKPNLNDLNLTDEQLEQVSGGILPILLAFSYGAGAGFIIGSAFKSK